MTKSKVQTAEKAYNKAVAAAWKVYEKARATAWEAREKAIDEEKKEEKC